MTQKPFVEGGDLVVPVSGAVYMQSVNTDPYTVTQADLISGQIVIHVTWPTPFPAIPPMASCQATVSLLRGSNLVYQVCMTKNCTAVGIDVVIGFYGGRSGNPGDIIQVHASAHMPNTRQ